MLENISNQPTKFRLKNWIETNDDAPETYDSNSQIKFKTSMLKSSLCYDSDANILVNGPVIVEDTQAAYDSGNNITKQEIFKNGVSFTDSISEINNSKTDSAKEIKVVMLVYSLTACSDNYSKISINLWQYYRDKTSLYNNDNIVDFTAANHSSKSFEYKQKITGKEMIMVKIMLQK